MKVALHCGQFLQPVPGGIGRYAHSLLRVLPTVDVEVVAFAAGARPPGVPRRVSWIDLGAPHGSVRYEMWHRLGRPAVDIAADVIHATSLAVPPVRDAALVVTVHDIAFLRVPHVTTRRGVSFHRRALGVARRTRTSCSRRRRSRGSSSFARASAPKTCRWRRWASTCRRRAPTPTSTPRSRVSASTRRTC